MSNSAVSLRPVDVDDSEFLVQVYASTRESELALSGWDLAQQDAFVRMQFAAQQRYYGAAFPRGEHSIILVDGQPVGRIYTADCDDEIRILDITILPAKRNGGVGTQLILDVLEHARHAGKPVRIHVENYNPSLRLFQRLGFAEIQDDGLNLLLEWRPS